MCDVLWWGVNLVIDFDVDLLLGVVFVVDDAGNGRCGGLYANAADPGIEECRDHVPHGSW